MSLLPNLDQMTDNEKLAVLESIQKSIAESKEIQKKKIGENVDLVVQALKKIESDIRDRFDAVGNTIEKRVLSIKDGRDGANGKDGRDGKDGKSGRDGLKGDRGVDGQAGRDGVDGIDGISVVNAHIDFDDSLVITLSDGRELNVGEVVSQDIAEKIKVISTMSTNGAVGIKDEGTSISTGVKTINFVGAAVTATNSGDDVTVNVSSGTGTVTSVAALTLGTSGTDLSSTVANSTTTPVITLNVPTASATNRGALSSTDWTTFNNKGSGTVTSVTGTSPVVSSGGTTPAISLAASYGDTQNPYASKTANFVLAAPNGSAGVPTFRALVASDIPTLNQSTTGSAATLTTPRAIYGNNFDGSAALTQIIASTYGGTGNGFTKFTGATTAEKTYTLPDASSTIVVQGGALGTPSSGTVTNLTGTASININGTVGATTASSGAFTTLSATGVTTVQAGTAALPAITTAGDTNTGIFFPAADTVGVSTGGSERLRVDSSGNVGIGTTAPNSKLTVGTASYGQAASVAQINGTSVATANSGGIFNIGCTDAAAADVGGSLGFTANGGINGYPLGQISGRRESATSSNYSSYLAFTTCNSGGSISERMRIDSSGNVLVGTTSAVEKLTVNGKAFIGTGSGAGVSAPLLVNSTPNLYSDFTETIIAFDPTTSTTGTGGGISFGGFYNAATTPTRFAGIKGIKENATAGNYSGALVFATNVNGGSPTERMRINSNGTVGIGVAGQSAVSGINGYLSVKNTANDGAWGIVIESTGATTNRGIGIVYGNTPNSTGQEFAYWLDSTTLRFSVRSNGGIANYSANNVNLSDARTKTDIQDAGSYLAKICAIPVRTFKYKDQTDDLLNLGCIAQEVESVAPELIDLSGFGETPEDGIPLKAIYQTDLQYALMKCIQEQQALITALTARITALEAK